MKHRSRTNLLERSLIVMARGKAKSPTLPLPPPRISVDEFTESVFSGVLRALQTQRGPRRPGPIIYGIIYVPEAGGLQIQQARGASKASE
jgi:hypothetical protein